MNLTGHQREKIQKQPSRSVLGKSFSENMQQIYRRTPILKCDFNGVALQLYWNHTWDGCSPENLLHIFRNLFLRAPLEGYFWRIIVMIYLVNPKIFSEDIALNFVWMLLLKEIQFTRFSNGKVKHELRVVSYEFRYTSYKFKFTSYEFNYTTYAFKVEIHELRVQLHELRVQILELRV